MKKKSERENTWECLERLDINLVGLYGEIRTLKGQVEALEAQWDMGCGSRVELRERMDGISENYRQTHVHATKLQQRILDLEESMRPAHKPPKTCRTCRYPIRTGPGEYACWRHDDGKTKCDVLGSTPACNKYKER